MKRNRRLKNSEPTTGKTKDRRYFPAPPDHRQRERRYLEMAYAKHSKDELFRTLPYHIKQFCKEYLICNNAAEAWKIANPRTLSFKGRSNQAPFKILKNPKVQQFLSYIQKDLEYVTGVSKEKQVREFRNIAYADISDLHENWNELKDFERLREERPEIMSAIQSIETKTETVMQYHAELDKKVLTRIDYVKVRLHDKIKALEALNKLMGYNAPEKVEVAVQHTLDVEDLEPSVFNTLLETARKNMKYGEQQSYHHSN